MSTYTQSLGLELITPGSQAGLWGNTTNNTFTLIDQAICGVTPLSFASASGSTITLTDYNGAEDQARSAVLNITGTAAGSNTVVIPNKQKTYLVRNFTGQTVTFQTPTPGASYPVDAGNSILIFCDGNNNVYTGIEAPSAGTLPVNRGGTSTTTFTAGFVKSPGGSSALTSASTVALGSEVSGTLPVANGGTGLSSLTANSVLLVNGSGAVTPTVGGASGQVLTWNGSAWGAAAPASGVASVSSTSIGVSPTTGNVVITLSGANVTSALGYTPYSSTNPAGYITSASLAAYGALTGNQTWSGNNGFVGGITSQAYNFTNNTSLFWQSSNTIVLAINGGFPYTFPQNGNATTVGTWTSLSDARLKENVEQIGDCLDKVMSLNPVKFSMKRENLTAPNRFGLIAQELETVIPELVDVVEVSQGEINDVKAVAYQELIPILVKAIQELKAEVDALKAVK